MEWALLLLIILSVILIQATDVAALTSNSDIIGIAVAGCASFSLLALVIGMLIASCNWRAWFGSWMRQQGKIRMPEGYFKKKNGETKQRLISGSRSVIIPQMNGHLPRPVVDREKFVQGWRQGNPSVTHRIYEEKDAMVELGEEVDDEYKIEAEVVDNEILDVGPFKQDHSKEIPIKGDVYPEPYIYSAADRTEMSGRSVGNSVKPPSDFRTSAVVSDKSGRSVGNSVKPTSDSRTSGVVSDIAGRSVGNSVKPTNDSRTSAIIRDISGRSVGNSMKPTSDSRSSAVVNDISDRSVGNSVKPTSDSRSWGAVTKSNGAEYYMAGTNKDNKFDEAFRAIEVLCCKYNPSPFVSLMYMTSSRNVLKTHTNMMVLYSHMPVSLVEEFAAFSVTPNTLVVDASARELEAVRVATGTYESMEPVAQKAMANY